MFDDLNSPSLAILAMGPCRGCSACCQHVVRPPFYVIGDPEWARLMAERPDLVAEIEGDRRAWPSVDEERPCLWLDSLTGLCRHYDYRPAVCADFEPGEDGCQEHRAGRGLPPLQEPGPCPTT